MLFKLSNNLGEPPRSMVQSLLQKILILKGGVRPPKSRPMQIPFLSHEGFRGILRSWLRQAATARKEFLVPFSPCNVVGNHHQMMEQFNWDTPPSCTRQDFKEPGGLLYKLALRTGHGSVDHLVQQYAAKQSADISDISLTVQLAATEPKLRVFQRRFNRHKTITGIIWLKDLCQLCVRESFLHASLVSHIKRIFKQQRGSAIENQISPALVNIAASYLEDQWFQWHKDALKNHAQELYIVRYVDNRLVLCRPYMQEFLADFLQTS